MENKSEKSEKRDLYDVDYRDGFSVECHNLLNEPKALQFPGYEELNIDRLKDDGSGNKTPYLFNISRVSGKTNFLIILRYFEYICLAKVSLNYLQDIMKGGLDLVKSFGMIKHHLRIRLNKEITTGEQITEMYIEYAGKVMY